MTARELAKAGRVWHNRKRAERDAMDAVYAAIRQAATEGISQAESARIAGVDRMTVRRALGL